MRKCKRVREIFTDPTTGIFSALDNLTMPWSEEQQPLPLDIVYIEQHSGDKIAAPIVTNRLNDSGVLPAEGLAVIANCLKATYFSKWSALWEAFQIEYNPIENYSMVEDGTDTTEKTGTDTNVKSGSLDRSGAITKSGSERDERETTRTGNETNTGTVTRSGSETDGGTMTRTGSETDNTSYDKDGSIIRSGSNIKSGSELVHDDNVRSGDEVTEGTKADNAEDANEKIYGYNSSTAVPSSSSDRSASHKDKHTYNDVEDDRSITTTYNNVTDTKSETESFSGYEETTDKTHTYQNVTDTENKTHTYNNVADTENKTHTYNDVKDTEDFTHTYDNVAETDSRIDTYNNITDELTHDTEDNTTHHLTRSGNIGVTTSQQMLTSEIELRQWLFFESVMNDIDRLLTLSIY